LSKRGNSEGSLYPTIEGWRGYAWCTRPDGTRYRKYVRGETYEEAQQAWFKLREQASRGPVSSDVPKVAEFLAYWLQEIVEPNLAPKTYERYEMFSRLHIIPYLGGKRIDKIQVKDVRQWLNKLAAACQCCMQGKDKGRRPESKKRCCAIGKCCHQKLSMRSRKDARETLRAALSCAIEDEMIARNPVSAVKMTKRREPKSRRKRQAWTVDDARWFLEAAWHNGKALYAAFVLVLVLGLRRGEVLGLAWEQVDLDAAELDVGQQFQRARRQLMLREVKTEASEAPLPLPALCVTALRIRQRQQDGDKARAGSVWVENGLIFTTGYGTPIEPRNFNRVFGRCVIAARVPNISVHGTRKTCASLLASLDVHPRMAMRILRHSKIAVTMEIYTEAPSEATYDALRKLGDLLAS
jgi:integrase